MSNYHYFVSYRFPDGFGRCEIFRDEPITSLKDVEEVESDIRLGKDYPLPVLVTSWQKFERDLVKELGNEQTKKG